MPGCEECASSWPKPLQRIHRILEHLQQRQLVDRSMEQTKKFRIATHNIQLHPVVSIPNYHTTEEAILQRLFIK